MVYGNPFIDWSLVEKVTKPLTKAAVELVVGEVERKTGLSLTTKHKKWSFENDPAPGTHIRVRRMFVPGIVVPGHFLKMPVRTLVSDKYGINLYEHHGICIGDGKVIHFAAADGDFSTDIKIRKTTLKKFLDGGTLEIRDFDAVDNGMRNSNDEVVKRAEAELKGQNFGSYNLLTNNCEHFANYCVFGERFSEQAGDKEPGLKDWTDYIDDENLPNNVIF